MSLPQVEERILAGARDKLGVVTVEVCTGRHFDVPLGGHDVGGAGAILDAAAGGALDAPMSERERRLVASNIDDPRVDDLKAYSQKMGKWRRDTVQAAQDSLWWLAIGAAFNSHQPLTHHLRCVQQLPHDIFVQGL